MRITKLQAENVKRLKAVEITPEGNVIVIGGNNGEGKTSVLDSIMYTFAGKGSMCEKPLRQGQKKGMSEITLDNGLKVRRTYTASGGGSVVVENADGARPRGPQGILDAMAGDLTFDPLAFTRMDAKKQAEVVKRITGLDFDALDGKRQALYEQRRDENRSLKEWRAKAEGMPKHPDAPAQPVSVNELIQERDRRHHHNQALLKAKEEDDAARRRIIDLQDQIKEIQGEIYGLENKRRKLTPLLMTTPADVEEIDSRIASAEEINAKVRDNAARAHAESEIEGKQTVVDEITEHIERIDAQKQEQLQAANMPIKGLSFDEYGVQYNGVPFGQCSQAEQLRISVAMGAAMNPDLNVMLIRDGSLLDSNSLKLLADFADEHDYQIWLERVGEEAGPSAVIIEDGMVKGAKQELEAVEVN